VFGNPPDQTRHHRDDRIQPQGQKRHSRAEIRDVRVHARPARRDLYDAAKAEGFAFPRPSTSGYRRMVGLLAAGKARGPGWHALRTAFVSSSGSLNGFTRRAPTTGLRGRSAGILRTFSSWRYTCACMTSRWSCECSRKVVGGTSDRRRAGLDGRRGDAGPTTSKPSVYDRRARRTPGCAVYCGRDTRACSDQPVVLGRGCVRHRCALSRTAAIRVVGIDILPR